MGIRRISKAWKFIFSLTVLLLAAGSLRADSWWTDAEREQMDRALAEMNLSRSDLGFTKDVGEPRLALGWIRIALEDPEVVERAGDALWSAVRDTAPTSLWVTASALLEVGDAAPPAQTEGDARDTWEGLDPELAAALSPFMEGARQANRLLERAYSGLSAEDRSYLAAAALVGAFNAEDDGDARASLAAAGISAEDIAAVIAEGRELDATPAAEKYLERLGRIDRGAVLEAGRIFQRTVAELADRARTVTNWPSGNVLLVTDLGSVRIASTGDEAYSDRALLILTPGGRNAFSGEAGVANGLQGQRLSAIIDLGGSDHYRGEGLLSAGSALFGVAVVYDSSGDDTWRAAYAGQGFGCYGAAWLEDQEGDDDYEARALAQGASVLGIGVLRDNAGNDRYDVGLQGQACAVLPGLAALVDRAGIDRYYAGGLEPDHERNPERFLSLGQGFAIGLRPFAGGGVALLADLAGNDTYGADVFGQGVSYYYSAAFLLEGGGHDNYSVHHYGQGAGIHLSLGFLMDLDGDDDYRGGILVQGAAHDYAMGGLLDRAGRDTYAADANSQGHGMNNALGWLVDSGGDDVYSARDPTGTQGVGNSGGDRDYGSLGFLLDLGGRDAYSCAVSNDVPLLRPLYGVVHDVSSSAAMNQP